MGLGTFSFLGDLSSFLGLFNIVLTSFLGLFEGVEGAIASLLGLFLGDNLSTVLNVFDGVTHTEFNCVWSSHLKTGDCDLVFRLNSDFDTDPVFGTEVTKTNLLV